MTVFDQKRLPADLVRVDVVGLRSGDYTDRYFTNVTFLLEQLAAAGYRYAGDNPRRVAQADTLAVGDAVVEAQVFHRRSPCALVAGVDVVLHMLRAATGFWRGGDFVPTWNALEVDALHDGAFADYGGNPAVVQPVLKIRGRYRDFAVLETPLLGVLTRASRIATNVYEVLQASNGKQVLYFPARFDLMATQELDGYAYWLAVQRYNHDSGRTMPAMVSTHAQARWWGGRGGGTIPHALIATFLADDVEAMLRFAEHMPLETPRILLADFDNDTMRAARRTLAAFWQRYRAAYVAQDELGMRRWTLHGVRLDTAANMRDAGLPADADKGVSAALVRAMREALNTAWQAWDVPSALVDVARAFCANVQIVVTGGFNRERIAAFERDGVPVDSYGVGSSFLVNGAGSNTDFTMDVVRVQVAGAWVDVAKVGRTACDNPDLQRVNMEDLS